MKLSVLAVGHRQPAWVNEGCAEYLKRIRDALAAGSRLVVLDEKGDDLTTLQLARRLEAWMQDGRDVALLIGGADGLDEEFKQQADDKLRLSSLTLPHGMARLVLCEQLYRAVSVLKNHPYHREG